MYLFNQTVPHNYCYNELPLYYGFLCVNYHKKCVKQYNKEFKTQSHVSSRLVGAS